MFDELLSKLLPLLMFFAFVAVVAILTKVFDKIVDGD
jgi:hypothetical protein